MSKDYRGPRLPVLNKKGKANRDTALEKWGITRTDGYRSWSGHGVSIRYSSRNKTYDVNYDNQLIRLNNLEELYCWCEKNLQEEGGQDDHRHIE